MSGKLAQKMSKKRNRKESDPSSQEQWFPRPQKKTKYIQKFIQKKKRPRHHTFRSISQKAKNRDQQVETFNINILTASLNATCYFQLQSKDYLLSIENQLKNEVKIPNNIITAIEKFPSNIPNIDLRFKSAQQRKLNQILPSNLLKQYEYFICILIKLKLKWLFVQLVMERLKFNVFRLVDICEVVGNDYRWNYYHIGIYFYALKMNYFLQNKFRSDSKKQFTRFFMFQNKRILYGQQFYDFINFVINLTIQTIAILENYNPDFDTIIFGQYLSFQTERIKLLEKIKFHIQRQFEGQEKVQQWFFKNYQNLLFRLAKQEISYKEWFQQMDILNNHISDTVSIVKSVCSGTLYQEKNINYDIVSKESTQGIYTIDYQLRKLQLQQNDWLQFYEDNTLRQLQQIYKNLDEGHNFRGCLWRAQQTKQRDGLAYYEQFYSGSIAKDFINKFKKLYKDHRIFFSLDVIPRFQYAKLLLETDLSTFCKYMSLINRDNELKLEWLNNLSLQQKQAFRDRNSICSSSISYLTKQRNQFKNNMFIAINILLKSSIKAWQDMKNDEIITKKKITWFQLKKNVIEVHSVYIYPKVSNDIWSLPSDNLLVINSIVDDVKKHLRVNFVDFQLQNYLLIEHKLPIKSEFSGMNELFAHFDVWNRKLFVSTSCQKFVSMDDMIEYLDDCCSQQENKNELTLNSYIMSMKINPHKLSFCEKIKSALFGMFK